jgi:four helix bundle protein
VDQRAEELKERTKRFAISLLEFAETLPRSHAGEALSKQLIRAGLGVAGNYRSACRARSHAEFTARVAIVLEEADESELWLDVIGEKLLGTAALRARLLQESRELRAIFAKAVVTARSKERTR